MCLHLIIGRGNALKNHIHIFSEFLCLTQKIFLNVLNNNYIAFSNIKINLIRLKMKNICKTSKNSWTVSWLCIFTFVSIYLSAYPPTHLSAHPPTYLSARKLKTSAVLSVTCLVEKTVTSEDWPPSSCHDSMVGSGFLQLGSWLQFPGLWALRNKTERNIRNDIYSYHLYLNVII